MLKKLDTTAMAALIPIRSGRDSELISFYIY
jgi:hypothetical protein